MSRNEILDANICEDDESSLRPSSFDEYVGQTNLKENLKVFVGAAKLRDESLTLLFFLNLVVHITKHDQVIHLATLLDRKSVV